MGRARARRRPLAHRAPGRDLLVADPGSVIKRGQHRACLLHGQPDSSEPRSYRHLPLRFGEFGLVHRNELSGTLAGLLRVRAFTQDDAHLFLRPDQIEEEIIRTVSMYREVYATFGFDSRVALSTRPENRMGDDRLWDQAEDALASALDRLGQAYQRKPDDGAFYGPKIDFGIEDGLGRPWQCGTIQLDFQLPERFDLTYTGEAGRPHRPVMIHPAAMGSIERFMAVLIEEYDGHFPTWLAPVQVLVLPISEKSVDYARAVVRQLAERGLRGEVDPSGERINKKIRNAHARKPPHIVVVGPNEAEAGTISFRDRDQKEQRGIPLNRFVDHLTADVAARRRQPYMAGEFIV